MESSQNQSATSKLLNGIEELLTEIDTFRVESVVNER